MQQLLEAYYNNEINRTDFTWKLVQSSKFLRLAKTMLKSKTSAYDELWEDYRQDLRDKLNNSLASHLASDDGFDLRPSENFENVDHLRRFLAQCCGTIAINIFDRGFHRHSKRRKRLDSSIADPKSMPERDSIIDWIPEIEKSKKLTKREKEYLRLKLAGKTDAEIAKHIDKSLSTVRSTIRKIKTKTALSKGLIDFLES